MEKVKKIKYSKIRKKIFPEKVEKEIGALAEITHYLQANSVHVDFTKKSVKNYLNGITPSIVSDPEFQYKLDISYDVPFPPPENPKFTFIDLFAGIGGFRLAMQNLKGKCVFSSEWDPNAQKTYEANFGEVPFGDITKEDTKKFIPKKFDLLCAGFPCQAFSIAGKRGGFEDARGTLFFDVAKIIEKHRPKAFFLENVKNLASHDNGNTLKVIRDVLENTLQYKVKIEVLNSMTHANIPQNRERIFIVGFDPSQIRNYDAFNFPDKRKLTKTIHDIIDQDKQDDHLYYNSNHMYYKKLSEVMKKKDTVYQWRRIYVRENKSKVCPTLTANMGAGGHNVPLILDKYGIRKLSPKECFAFQGFPMNKYRFPNVAKSKLYMQAGNSVTVPLIQVVAESIIKIIE